MIADALAGKRIAVTGATGFLGTAIVERVGAAAGQGGLVAQVTEFCAGLAQSVHAARG